MNCLSIIVCTYNPEEDVFKRCLTAVQKLKHPAVVEVECVVVDNNSKLAVANLPYVQEVLKQTPWIRLVTESTPGLSYARIKGFNESKGEWVIFFDDDNEPEESYLTALSKEINNYPNVGIWGPGHIDVEYLSAVDEWFNKNKQYFQARSFDKVLTSNDRAMQYFYPPGTGMMLRRDILSKWISKFLGGGYTMLGRTGGSMESSEDVQIVYTGLDMNYHIGSSPAMQLNHLTSAKKATFDYIKRLTFGISVGGPRLHREIQQNGTVYTPGLPDTSKVNQQLIVFYLKYLVVPKYKKKNFLIAHIHQFATITGRYRFLNVKLPALLQLFIRHFELEKARA